MRRLIPFSLLIMLIIVTPIVQAQDLCETIAKNAFREVQVNCADTPDGEACYGFSRLTPSFVDEETPIDSFTSPADFMGIENLVSVETVPIDVEADEWGIAYFRFDTDVTQTDDAVILVMMGDVTLEQVDSDAEYAFNISSASESTCADVPNSVLIQGPTDTAIDLEINEIPMQLGSTMAVGFDVDDEGNSQFWVAVMAGELTLFPDTPEAIIIPEQHVVTSPINRITFSAPQAWGDSDRDVDSKGFYVPFYQFPELILNYDAGDVVNICEITMKASTNIWFAYSGAGFDRSVPAVFVPTNTYYATNRTVDDNGIEWYRVEYANQQLWTNTQDADVDCTLEIIPDEGVCTVTASSEVDTLPARVGAGFNRSVVSFLSMAISFTVVDQLFDAEGNWWYEIDNNNGGTVFLPVDLFDYACDDIRYVDRLPSTDVVVGTSCELQLARNAVQGRVGPDRNRSVRVILSLDDELVAIGEHVNNDGTRWYITELGILGDIWVSAEDVTNDCPRLTTVAPPPVIFAQPTIAPQSTSNPFIPSPNTPDEPILFNATIISCTITAAYRVVMQANIPAPVGYVALVDSDGNNYIPWDGGANQWTNGNLAYLPPPTAFTFLDEGGNALAVSGVSNGCSIE